MKIGGWKTRSVFDRYNTVDASDWMRATSRMLLPELIAKLNRRSGTVVPEVPANNEAGSMN